MTTAVEEIGASGRARADATLEAAFAADPVMRWFWPDSEVYRASFPRFVEAIAGAAYTRSTAWWAHRGAAVALWLGPGVAPDDDALTMVMVESVDPGLLGDLVAFGELVSAHHPTEPHWYLPFTGVDPFAQGTGLGSTLLAHALSSVRPRPAAGLPRGLDAAEPPPLCAPRLRDGRRAPGRLLADGRRDAPTCPLRRSAVAHGRGCSARRRLSR